MKIVGQYDRDLQMFVEEERPLDMAHLCFLRALGERGLLDHPVEDLAPEVYNGLTEESRMMLARARLGVTIYSIGPTS